MESSFLPKMEEKVTKSNGVQHVGSSTKKKKIPSVEVTFDEKTSLLSMLYPKISAKSKSTNPKKKYACAVCKSSCDLYSLFLHMKQVHSGLLCCYCTKLFKKASDLEIHIKTTHRVPKRYYHNTKQFAQISGQKYNFVCAQCTETLSYKDLDKHACSKSGKKQFDCPHCGRSFEAQKQLDMHLSNGWCKEMRWLTDPSKEDSQKIFKVLTGKDTDPSIFEKEKKKETAVKSSAAATVSKKKSADYPAVKMTISSPPPLPPIQQLAPLSESPQHNTYKKPKKEVKPKKVSSAIMTQKEAIETKENTIEQEKLSTSLKISIPLKKERKSERLARLSKEISVHFGKLRVLLDALAETSAFCQQVKIVNVDAVFLLSHLMKTHDRQLIHKYLGEDAQDSITRIKSFLRDSKECSEVVFSYSTDAKLDEKYHGMTASGVVSSSNYEELFKHLNVSNGVLTCQLCGSIFLNYGSFRSHICFGPSQEGQTLKTKFRFMNQDFSTFLDFQRHLRLSHNTCEICFTSVPNQVALAGHCADHMQELMCMKCFMTYEDSKQFKKHLLAKHAEESVECGACYQKTWSHVYHFCIPIQGALDCEVCDMSLDSFAKYRVHLRTHTGAEPHLCTAKGCDKTYVSKQLLLKHHIRRHPDLRPAAAAQLESRRTKKYLEKMGASSLESVMLCQQVLIDLISVVIPYEQPEPAPPNEPFKELEPPNQPMETEPQPEEPEPEEEFDPIASAVASIMGPDGAFDIRKSPVKSYPPSAPIIPPNPPPLIPLKDTQPPKNESVLKALRDFRKEKPVDPLKQMLEKEKGGRVPLPPPSEVLHPNSFHELINGGNSQNNQSSSDSSDDSEDSDNNKEDLPPKAEEDEGTKVNPVLGGIWNQDLMFVSNAANSTDSVEAPFEEGPKKKGGCKVLKPRYQIEDAKKTGGLKTSGLKSLMPSKPSSWEVLLSESSGSDNEDLQPKKARIVEKSVCDKRVALKEHDYCFAVYKLAREQPEKPKEDLSEMDKILSNVALGAFESSFTEVKSEKKKKKKKKKKHRKKHKKQKTTEDNTGDSSDSEVDVTNNETEVTKPKQKRKRAWKPKFHIPLPGASQGVTATAARPHFSSSEGEEDEFLTSGGELASSDLDTDFSADENPQPKEEPPAPEIPKPISTPKLPKKQEKKKSKKRSSSSQAQHSNIPSLKLKIKLPMASSEPPLKKAKTSKKTSAKKVDKNRTSQQALASDAMSKKMRESLALNKASSSSSSSSSDEDYSEGDLKPLKIAGLLPPQQPIPAQQQPILNGLLAKPDDKLYCVCQSPHDAVSEMIGCDAPDCKLEWFHFECVGIMVPPEGQWYCPECTKRYNIRATY